MATLFRVRCELSSREESGDGDNGTDGLEARAKEDAAIQRAQAEQLKSLELSDSRSGGSGGSAGGGCAPEGSKEFLRSRQTITPASRVPAWCLHSKRSHGEGRPPIRER